MKTSLVMCFKYIYFKNEASIRYGFTNNSWLLSSLHFFVIYIDERPNPISLPDTSEDHHISHTFRIQCQWHPAARLYDTWSKHNIPRCEQFSVRECEADDVIGSNETKNFSQWKKEKSLFLPAFVLFKCLICSRGKCLNHT